MNRFVSPGTILTIILLQFGQFISVEKFTENNVYSPCTLQSRHFASENKGSWEERLTQIRYSSSGCQSGPGPGSGPDLGSGPVSGPGPGSGPGTGPGSGPGSGPDSGSSSGPWSSGGEVQLDVGVSL